MFQRVRGLSVALATCAFCLTQTEPAASQPPQALPDRLGLVVQGDSTEVKPPIVLLHGICGDPRNSCAAFAGVDPGDLVCARADLSCPAGGAMWSGGEGAILRIEAAVKRAATESHGRVDPNGPRVLVGFSQGAYVALRAARATPGRYPSVMLIGAFIRSTRAELENAGIHRLTLAAGDLDGSASTMKETARRLHDEGFDARFVSLGRVAHTYVADDPKKLADAVAWTRDGLERR